jgi:type VII secretion integral membrane protein EccD
VTLAASGGLARVTVRGPRRRVDLTVPDQVPLAEVLPAVLRRCGEDAGTWVLRRGDGATLHPGTALAYQGVRDGEVLYLVPREVVWPEPRYDDVVEEIAAGARDHGVSWGARHTRVVALVSAAAVLLAGLSAVVVVRPSGGSAVGAGALAGVMAVGLLGLGALLARAWGDHVVGGVAAGLALPGAAAAGALLQAGLAGGGAAGQVLVAGSALTLAAVSATVAVGRPQRAFVAGVVVGLAGVVSALVGAGIGASGAAAVAVVAAQAGIGLAPALAVRSAAVPVPIVSAVPEVLAGEDRPPRERVREAVARADEVLAGCLLGLTVATVVAVAVLATAGGVAAPLLAAITGLALLLRARVFPAVAARLPLVTGGAVSLLVCGLALAGRAPGARLSVAAVAGVSLLVLLAMAASSSARARTAGSGADRPPSPYLARLADVADMTTVVALVPVVCAVLGLYAWVRGLVT